MIVPSVVPSEVHNSVMASRGAVVPNRKELRVKKSFSEVWLKFEMEIPEAVSPSGYTGPKSFTRVIVLPSVL